MPKKLKKVTGRFTKSEIIKISEIEDSPQRNRKLIALSKILNRDFNSVYQKWIYEKSRANKSSNKRVTMNIISEPKTTTIKLQIDKSILRPTKMDSQEVQDLHNELSKWIPQLGPYRGNIPLNKSFASAARTYLQSNFPEDKFHFQREVRDGKPTGLVRIFKKPR